MKQRHSLLARHGALKRFHHQSQEASVHPCFLGSKLDIFVQVVVPNGARLEMVIQRRKLALLHD